MRLNEAEVNLQRKPLKISRRRRKRRPADFRKEDVGIPAAASKALAVNSLVTTYLPNP